MRTCYYCHGEKMVEEHYQYDNEPLDESYMVSGVVEHCRTCEGNGEIEDECSCSAYCSCECICGAWDDVECDCWD